VRSVGTQVDPVRTLVISASVSADSGSGEMELRHEVSFEEGMEGKEVEKTIKVNGKDRFVID
jgi:hypothetical protein